MVRFWNKVDIRGRDECWNWEGAVVGGYGVTTYKGKLQKAHRVAYELETGNKPINVIDHLCKNRLCVNPLHLEDVTKKENTLRGESFSAKFARRTECNYGHPFDEENTVIDKRGYRACKTCRKLQSEKQRRKKGIKTWDEYLTLPRDSRKATHCKRGHEFNEENTRLHNGSQHCRKCTSLRNKQYYEARR